MNPPRWMPWDRLRALPFLLLNLLLLVVTTSPSAEARDWPQWRFDSARTAASPERLPPTLERHWSRQLPARRSTWDDPLNQDLMTFDRIFEPIVMGGRMFVGFNDQNKLVAFDTRSGQPLWTFYTESPVRLPPAGWRDRVFFCSDDGFLYCVDAGSGKLVWKFSGAPNSQHAIGNQRLTSAWPARGGPVIRDNQVYFAASIWPFMGTFIYALDADTGAVQWVNDGTGSQYIKQPHSAPSFAGVAPQGALVATEELLLVPGGRSVPAAFNRQNGALRYFEINAGGKGTGGSFVAADSKHFYVHTREKGTRAFDSHNGVKTAFMPNEPVLAAGLVYAATNEDKKPRVQCFGDDHKLRWELPADGSGDLIQAGSRLYAAGESSITAIHLPTGDEPARVVQTIAVESPIERLLAAEGKLFAVSRSGLLLAFGLPGEKPNDSDTRKALSLKPLPSTNTAAEDRAALLRDCDAEGYAFWFGGADRQRILALAEQSPFVQLAIVDSDRQRVDQLRRQLDDAGRYGPISVHLSEPARFRPPQYVANLVVVDQPLSTTASPELLASLYAAVRPYGGTMHLLVEPADRRSSLAQAIRGWNWEQAEVTSSSLGVVVRRVGALPGSADWTHQHGDIANTIKSNDRRVKLPLGVLWFGGNSHDDVLPRHGHGPPEQVVGGRLFIQGINRLSARDVYTGRVLWKRDFKDLGTFDVYYDKTYDDTPLDSKYNQVHIPGANGRGTNYVVTEDRVYVVEGNACQILSPETGKTLGKIQLPPDADGTARQWGYIGVYEDVLIGGLGFARYRERSKLTFEEDEKLTGNRAGFGSKSLDRAASLALVGFDRFSGKQLWRIDARHSFWHNGIVAGGGKVYCLDKNPQAVEDALRRRGKAPPATYRIVALDSRSGQPQWSVEEGVFGTWLGYSQQQDLLLQAGASGSDRLKTEVASGMTVYRGKDGSVQWKNEGLKYAGPCILHNEWIITNANSYSESAGAFRLSDGKPRMVPNPLTGELKPWKLTRAYGCNNVIASENLLTFRSGAAGFYDLTSNSGTGNFGGFKSGCTSNLVVANGVLNAPDYTRTCSCSYQNQTSLALVHMPDLEWWTVDSSAVAGTPGKTIERLGINFGAAGDRRDQDGRLWLEYPVVAGDSPPLSIHLKGKPRYFRQHASTQADSKQPWVMASGVQGVQEIRIGMQFPDPDTLESGLPIEHVADDAREDENGAVEIDGSDLPLADEGTQLVGLRFNKIALARDSAVRSAYIQFTSDAASDEETSLLISAQNAGNADRFRADSHDISRRPRTRREIAWNPPKWEKAGQAGSGQRTADLSALIRDVIRRDDWKPGNSIAFLISGNGKRIGVAGKPKSSKSPRLVVEGSEVPLDSFPAVKPTDHQVRLYLAAPRENTARCVFDVYLQDQKVLEACVLEPNGAGQVHTFENVQVGAALTIRLSPREGQAVVSGVEVTRENDQTAVVPVDEQLENAAVQEP